MSGEAQSLPDNSTFGQYKIVRLLGKGGMGEVYEVVHGILGTQHAIKLVHAEMMDQDRALERFLLEGRAMAGLSHPGIVQVDDFGQTENHHWLRMELMKGREVSGQKIVSLRDYIALHGGRLNEEDVSSFVEAMLEALAYAHDKGLVHRDLKPSNILFDGNRLKVADFGLVNAAGADWMQTQVGNAVNSPNAEDTLVDSGTSNSRSQSLMGTFAYMSPEQRQGLSVDARSDLYAIGLMAFHMLTGKETPGFKVASQMVEGLSAGWDVWLERALQENPDDRFSSAREMDKALAFPPDIQEADPVLVHKPASVDFVSNDPPPSAVSSGGDSTSAQPAIANEPVANSSSEASGLDQQSSSSSGSNFSIMKSDSLKKIFIGVALFVVGWTLQNFYFNRLVYSTALTIEGTTLSSEVNAKWHEETYEDRIDLRKLQIERKEAYRKARDSSNYEQVSKINQEIEALEKDIADAKSKIEEKDETLADKVDAETTGVNAKAIEKNSLQGATSMTGFAIVLKIIGIILIIPPCLAIIPSTESTRVIRLVALALVSLGIFSMLKDDSMSSLAFELLQRLAFV
ncbi:MAG: hypothetical protein CMI30_04050 [Opitutae bacterium]|nr:hypothetical protein [Opitutae bacterium]